MSRLSTFILACAFSLLYIGTFAQPCTINNANTTAGFTPNPAVPIIQGVAYGQTIQVYIPSTVSVATVDSVHINNIGGLPTGITYSFNPASGTVLGGGHGCIWFSGTTSDTVGTYKLTFGAGDSAFTNLGAFALSNPIVSGQFSYSFKVQAPLAVTCDTIINLGPVDTVTYFGLASPSVGYVSGSGSVNYGGSFYQQTICAEKFTGLTGNMVTAAYLFFGKATVLAADSNKTVTVSVYDASGTSAAGHPGAPGATPFDSATLTLRQIAIAAAAFPNSLIPLHVTFAGTHALAAPDFFISVTYPTTTGDTVVVLTNTGSTPYGKGWVEVGGGWYPYDSLLGGALAGSLGNDIIAVSCGTAIATSAPTFTGVDSKQLNIFPNPTNDVLNIQWSERADAEVVVYDMTGKEIKRMATSGTLSTMDVSNLASGMYIIHVSDKQTQQNQSMRFVKF